MLHTGRMTRGLSWHSLTVNGAFGWRVGLLVVLLLSMFATSIAPTRAAVDAYVDTDVLYLRADPSTNSEIVAEMTFGDYISVIDGPTEDGWYFLDFLGLPGWAYGGYLSIDGELGWAAAEDSSVGGSVQSVWIATDAINVRAEPSLDSHVIGTAGQGEAFEVVGDSSGGFYPIAYGSGTGWAAAEFLSWSPVAVGAERWIDVDRSSSTIRLMVGNDSIAVFWGSMGFDDSEYGFYATALGTYYVYEKTEQLTWTDWARGYIQFWVAFDPERYNGFHGWTMDANGYVIDGGDGLTGGCVALDPGFAESLFRFATFGMRVEIHW